MVASLQLLISIDNLLLLCEVLYRPCAGAAYGHSYMNQHGVAPGAAGYPASDHSHRYTQGLTIEGIVDYCIAEKFQGVNFS